MHKLARLTCLLLVAGLVTACGLPWLGFAGSDRSESTPMPTPTPTPSPTPMSTLDAFMARVTSDDFQAAATVSGTVLVKVAFGSSSGPITGTFKVSGGDSDASITANILGNTITYDSIVVGDSSYSRSNGGGWSRSSASGKTLQAFLRSGIVLVDAGLETKFGRELHHLTVADSSGVDPAAFGITAGSGQSNLAIESLSFWAESDGTPAGVSLSASLDQKVSFATAHETIALDISIGSLSGVTITAPI